MTDINVEIDMSENDRGQPYMVDCLNDPKHSRFGKNKDYEDLLYIVTEFREKSLVMGDRAMASYELKGRREVYNQISHAFQIAQTLLHRSNQHHLENLLKECGMTAQAQAFEKKKGTNWWAYVCALLYGSWQEKDEEGSVFLVFERNRSAEKYGNVMRHLYENKVKANAAAMYIETFNDPVFGKALLGIERADRAKHAKQPKGGKLELKHKKGFIQRGESTDNDDVFYTDKPVGLPDAVEFGTATFKVFGSKLMIVGYERWEEERYEKHVIARGRKIKKLEDEVRAADKKRKAESLAATQVFEAEAVDDECDPFATDIMVADTFS
ncbi:hypothetical protein K9B33_18715 [Sphingobium sp. 3R8]|uniref:hypothetical protein n=1 Tax=Sphingobium sp. 3R8 TaxID=2874921 RepID=UPI001CCA6C69|nr:hypothetical protein [Sphingobium sp. 3R8]MBZ9649573.1 hypothetical protein [Sphingobium sp. 3R8]